MPLLIHSEFGNVTIAKETEPISSARFSYTGDLGSFSLENGESRMFSNLPAGTYTVEEADATGWELESILCDSENVITLGNSVSIDLGASEAISCTFYSSQLEATADGGGPYSGEEGGAVALDASSTTRKEMVTAYQWDCTNDGSVDEIRSSPHGGSCIYADNGAYTLKLTAVDIFGHSSTDTAPVSIENVVPEVDAGSDQTVTTNQRVNFSGSFTDPGTADTHHVEWDFGDGMKNWNTLTPQHTYTSRGHYTVTLTVSDDDGGTGSATMTVDVVNGAPAISCLTVSPPVIDEGERFILSGLLADPEQESMTLFIDWGDGTTATEHFPAGTTCFSISHPCPDDPPGSTEGETFDIQLKLSDDEGAFSVETAVIEVNNVAPSIDAGSDQRTVKDHPVAFRAAIEDLGLADTHVVTWDFGDGSLPVLGEEVTHVFTHPGSFSVTANVEDDDGGIGEDELSVVIMESFRTHLPVISR